MPKPENRFHELDSMRGLAAAVVVLSHTCNMFYPQFHAGRGLEAVLLYPFIAAHEAVMFFFLLSGFVLALPFLNDRAQPYPYFMARRVLRIYGPYLGSLALAVVGCALWHNRLGNIGWAFTTWKSPVHLRTLLDHLLFLGEYDTSVYNVVFWSLVVEMRVSIIFPFLFQLTQRIGSGTLGIIAVLVWYGSQHPLAGYVAVFLLGILLAQHRQYLGNLYRALSTWQRVLFVVTSFLLYHEGHRMTSIGPLWHLGDFPVALGAAGFILIALNSAIAGRSLRTAVPSFLGRISYSLYLVHGTVLFAFASLWLGKINRIEFVLLYLPAAILLSWCFYLAIEAPFTRLSRRVGKAQPVRESAPAQITFR